MSSDPGSNSDSEPERHDRSRSATPNDNKSASGRSRSASGSRSGSGSPPNRSRSRSRSRSVASNKSWTSDRKSGSGSPRSRTPSRSRSRSGSPKSRSATPKSRSVTPRSKSATPRSKSGSPRSKSGSPRSESRSPKSARSRSRSRSGSVKSHESGRSRSPESNRSKSGSPVSRRSDDGEVRRSKSRSLTPEERPETGDNLRSPGLNDSADEKRSKKNKVIDSDSEDDEDKEEADATALFGDADDISSEEEKEAEPRDEDARRSDEDGEGDRDRRSDDDNEQPILEDEEEKETEEPIPETRIDVKIPKISCDLGRDIHFVKLPNFLSVETRPFDPETYEDEIDEEETLDEEGRARLKLKVENTIRWREVFDNEGNIQKEANARFVRWSDGSLSLHLGSEIFDVYKQPLQGDHNHLFIRQGTGLQGQAVFRTKLSFRPHSTESFTHRKMTLSLADRSQKTSGIKILSQVGVDPDQDRKTLLKKEEEKLRQTFRAKPKRRSDSGRGAHSANASYREEDGSDEDGAISLNAIKNKYKSGAALVTPNKGGAIYSSDEEGSDFEGKRGRKSDRAKALKDSETSDESD